MCGKASMLLYIDLGDQIYTCFRRLEKHSCHQFTKQEAAPRQGGLKTLAREQKVRHRRKGKLSKGLNLYLTQTLCEFCLKESANKFLQMSNHLGPAVSARFWCVLVSFQIIHFDPCQPDHYNPWVSMGSKRNQKTDQNRLLLLTLLEQLCTQTNPFLSSFLYSIYFLSQVLTESCQHF